MIVNTIFNKYWLTRTKIPPKAFIKSFLTQQNYKLTNPKKNCTQNSIYINKQTYKTEIDCCREGCIFKTHPYGWGVGGER